MSVPPKIYALGGLNWEEKIVRPMGVTLWQAAPRLTNYLQGHSMMCKGKYVLKLGAGLVLYGIAAYYLWAKILMTDGDTHVLQRFWENVRQNCGSGDNDVMTAGNSTIDCRKFQWGSPHMEKVVEHGGNDMILGVDVIYREATIQPWFNTVAFFLEKPCEQFVLSRCNK